MMTATIEQMITIPESREVRFTLPETVPTGQGHITVIYTPKIVPSTQPYVNPLYGLGKKLGSKLTVEQFMQQKAADCAREIERAEYREV